MPLHDTLAQVIDVARHGHVVALGLHGEQRAEKRLEDREIGGSAGVAGVGREVEQHDADAALGAGRAAQRDELGDARGQHVGALGARVHGALAVHRERAAAMTAGAGAAGAVGAAAEHHRAGGAVEFGDGHHDGGLYRHQAAIGGAPCLERLELGGVGGDVGHVEPGENLLGRLRVVVGRAADQREAGERHQRVDRGAAIPDEVAIDRRTGVEAGGEGRHHAQAARLQAGDHAVVMRRIAGEQVGAHHQQADGASRAVGGQGLGALADLAGQARMVHADVGVLDGRLGLDHLAQVAARTVGVALHQQANHVAEIFAAAAEPVLQREEVGAHVLRGTGDEAQDARQTPQHRHLLGAAALGTVLLGLEPLQ